MPKPVCVTARENRNAVKINHTVTLPNPASTRAGVSVPVSASSVMANRTLTAMRTGCATSAMMVAALAEDTQYKYDGVSVETFKGTVQLSGFVKSRDQKNRAGDLAKKVPGVKQIVNNITVKESVN